MNANPEVKLHFLDYWRIVRQRIGLILVTIILVMVSASIYIFFLPKQYYSKVTIEIKPDNNKAVDPINFGQQNKADPQFLSTQFQILRKTEILYPVIDRLDLVKKFSPPGYPLQKSTVARMLDASMTVQDQRSSALIEIGIHHTDRDLAATIANEIAREYDDRRTRDSKSNVNQALAEMRDELNNTKTTVQGLAAAAAKIRQDDQIVDPDPDSMNAIVTLSDRPVLLNEEQLVKQRALVDQLSNRYASIEKLQPEELMEALRVMEIEDQTVVKNLPLLQEANAEEAKMLNSGVGENHPRLRALRAAREVYRKQLSDQLESIKRAQRTNLAIQKVQLESSEERFKTLKDDVIAEKGKTQKYVEKKSEYLMARQLLQLIEQRYAAASFDNKLTMKPVQIWERAEASQTPDKPRIGTSIAIAGIIALVSSLGLAFFIEYLDTSVKNMEDIEKFLGLPVLAVVPKDVAVLIRQKRDSADAEAYRILKANIEFNQADREANTFTLVSGGAGEGKSTTLNNLAVTFAKGGANVLIVDADIRRPSQHRFFDIENEPGLVEYLHGKVTLEEIIRTTKLDNMSFIPSGRLADDAGIVNSPRMMELIATLKARYDVVFFDSPPILGVSDASVLVSEVDNTIMVIQHRRFPRAMLQRVKQSVNHVGGKLIGVVLNNMDTKQDDNYQYYSSYNDYYAPRREKAEPKKKTDLAKKSEDEEY